MTAEDQSSREVNTVEEYSLYSLDRSIEGLNYIEADARSFCSDFDDSQLPSVCRQLTALASNLHSFLSFENEISSLFATNPAEIADKDGTLKETESTFILTLERLGKMIENQDIASVPDLFTNSLLPSLARFRSLIPLLKNHITTQYVNA